MANCPQQLAQLQLRTYSRTEFTALRARMKGWLIETMRRLSFDPDPEPPIDGEQWARVCGYIALGLAWHHGPRPIAPHAVASANRLT
ncbi:hypothetical protein FPJ27_36765 (plasmid) [Burkholderia sp. MS455]|uniref:hypothetical protein n=1 Tax=Burkholderia sp. MS455 TaxID=2811788 RepID=UPI00195BC243|nr:hypothetical protein [Burkholderia sp. MS455]QRR11766.1 hypothetical protein FPJ27_36765 [Burkholderia sp. MS455]